jgi:hypothetical protein
MIRREPLDHELPLPERAQAAGGAEILDLQFLQARRALPLREQAVAPHREPAPEERKRKPASAFRITAVFFPMARASPPLFRKWSTDAAAAK